MLSLNLRVLVAASAVLSSFFGLAGVTLDRIYRTSAEQALEETLQGHIYALIAAAGIDSAGKLFMPDKFPDARFSNPGSGLFAEVDSNVDDWRWRSASMDDVDIPFAVSLGRTEHRSEKIQLAGGRQLYVYSYGVVWSDSNDPNQAYTFSVAQDLQGFNAQLSAFRRSLWGSLGGVALLLLAVQGTILRWGLSPLKNATNELAAIEAGKQPRLQGTYPPELSGLTSNINTLLSQQQEHLERYRRTLGDLAHSLKTPLAVLQNAVENHQPSDNLMAIVREQVERMNQITGYQLQRAATSGWTALVAPVAVREIAQKVLNGLQKVYADKQVVATLDMESHIEFPGDEGDLMEIIGNLVDNAFKWSKRRVCVLAETKPAPQEGQWDLFLRVEDDGPGIPSEMVRYVMQRGRRAESDIAGHGIGLSIVRDIVQVYGGTLEIGVSKWGGAAVNVWLPAHSHVPAEAGG
jgi:two-component system sensor histidine kinase PhoQ